MIGRTVSHFESLENIRGEERFKNLLKRVKHDILYKRTWFVFLLIAIFTSGFSLEKDPVKTIWSISYFGDDDFFHEVSDIEVDLKRSMIYIADSGNHRVLVFDFQGKLLKIIGKRGQGPAEFSKPTGIDILEDSGVAVADFDNRRIQIFDKSWNFVKTIITKGISVADLMFIGDKIFGISSSGLSGYRFTLRSEKKTQPLVHILDKTGDIIQSISTDDFPDAHPFLRAIKNRVCLTLSHDDKLYLPYFAMNLIQVFDLNGEKIEEFERPLPFKPIAPKLLQQSKNEGIVRMSVSSDAVTTDAQIGPDGNLYLLTCAESYSKRIREGERYEDLPPQPMRIEVIEPKSHKVLRYISCDDNTRVFAVMDGNRLVYIYEDSEGEVILKCIQF
ncbi:MAG: 6-bladed beta-propeller [Candidatus Aminicenantes bacterium]|nr:MAG: 6-bladed beta-propeller [Candidatus Aminicenantes bacterium]